MRDSSLRRSTWLTVSAIAAALGCGCRSSSVKIARTWAGVTAGVFPPQAQPLHLQEPQRYQRQGDVVMPAHPTADLVVVQADLLVALAEQLLDPMPRAMHPGQADARRRVGIAQGVPRPRRGLATTQHRQPLAGAHVTVLVLGL